MATAKQQDTKLFACGDTHGNWEALNEKTAALVARYPEAKIVLISVGDFGFWPEIEAYSLDKINIYKGQLSIYFCPGNHENWWALKEREQKATSDIIKVSKNIFYCSFGATKRFNGKTFLFCGGADSIDKNARTLGVDWFPEEIINERDMTYLPDKKVHVIISHTSPNSVNYLLSKYLPNRMVYNTDPSAKYLNFVYDKYIPSRWYFGHWHVSCQFRDRDTEFTCLDKIDGTGVSLTEIYL